MKITVQEYRRTQTKHRKTKKGHGWTKLERIEMDCIWINLKNVGPPFSNLSVYIKISFTQQENHSQLLCGLDFANERLLLCQNWTKLPKIVWPSPFKVAQVSYISLRSNVGFNLHFSTRSPEGSWNNVHKMYGLRKWRWSPTSRLVCGLDFARTQKYQIDYIY